MTHIKERLLLIGNSSLCGGSGFPLSLCEWSFTICLTPYNVVILVVIIAAVVVVVVVIIIRKQTSNLNDLGEQQGYK